ALGDLFNDLGRLAGGGGLRAGDVLFFLDQRRVHVLAAGGDRVLGGNVHADAAQEIRIGPRPFHLHHDAGGAVVVDIAAELAGQADEAGRLHVLADDTD